MNLKELIAEGEALQRPSMLLSANPNSGGIVGYWGGVRGDVPESPPDQSSYVTRRRHILTIDEQVFPTLFERSIRIGPIGLFLWDTTNGVKQHLDIGYDQQFSTMTCTGVPLYGVAALSFPPFAAVSLYGSPAVETWLKELGVKRHEYGYLWNNDLVNDYIAEYMKRAPQYQKASGVDVIAGGWHMTWPEDDYYAPLETRLLFLTLRDSEPFYEGWFVPTGPAFYVKHRIT